MHAGGGAQKQPNIDRELPLICKGPWMLRYLGTSLFILEWQGVLRVRGDAPGGYWSSGTP